MIHRLRHLLPRIFIVGALLFFVLTIFALRSEYVTERVYGYVLTYIEEELKCNVEMDRPAISWLKGSWRLEHLSIDPVAGKGRDTFFYAERVHINFLPWFDILNRRIRIGRIRIEKPRIYLRIEQGRIVNLPHFRDEEDKDRMIDFSIQDVLLSNGTVTAEDILSQRKAAFRNVGLKIRPDLERKNFHFNLVESFVSITSPHLNYEITSLKGDFTVSKAGVLIRRADIAGESGELGLKDFFLDNVTGRWKTSIVSLQNVSGLKDLLTRGLDVSVKAGLTGEVRLSAIASGDRETFSVTGSTDAERIGIDRHEVGKTSSVFSVQGRWRNLEGTLYKADIHSQVHAGMLRYVYDTLPSLTGDVNLSLTISNHSNGGLNDVIQDKADGKIRVISGSIESSEIRVSGIPIKNLSAGFNISDDLLEIKKIRANVSDGLIESDVVLNRSSEKKFHSTTHLTSISIEDMEGLLSAFKNGSQSPRNTDSGRFKIRGMVSGDIDISGNAGAEPFFLCSIRSQIRRIDLFYDRPVLSLMTPSELTAEISGSGNEIYMKSLILETQNSIISMSGEVKSDNMDIAATVKSSDLGEFAATAGGGGDIKVNISGSIGNPRISSSLSLTDLSWKDYRVDRLSGGFDFADHVISTEGLKVAIGNSGLVLNGSMSFQQAPALMNAEIEVTEGRIEDITFFLGKKTLFRGDLSGRIFLKGSPDKLDGSIELSGKEISRGDGDIDSVKLNAFIDKGNILINKGEIRKKSDHILFTGRINKDWESDIDISSSLTLQDLYFLQNSGQRLSGEVRVEGKVTGNIKNPSLTGRAQLSDINYRDIELGNGRLDVSMKDMRLMISGDIMSSQIRGDVSLSDDKLFHLNILSAGLSLDQYLRRIGSMKDVTGEISYNVELNGILSEPRIHSAKGRISELQLMKSPFVIKSRRHVDFELSNGELVFNPFELTGSGTEFTVSGTAGIDGDVNIFLSGNIDMYLLEIFTGFVEKGAGVAEEQYSLTGKPLRVDGIILLSNGTFGIRNFEHLFTSVSGTLTLGGDTLILDNISGRVGDGSFRGGGTAVMSGIHLSSTDLTFDLAGLNVAYPKWLPSQIEGALRLSGEYPSLLLSGDIKVLNARYSERLDWTRLLSSLRDKLKKKSVLREKDSENMLRLDIGIIAERNIRFENNLGKAELSGDIRVKGDTSRPLINGELEIIEGIVLYKENEFRIISGVIEFPGGTDSDPVLDVSAIGKAREYFVSSSLNEYMDYEIQLFAQGTLEDLKVTMTSAPPLSELDIASLLSFGMTSRSLQERGNIVPAYGAASFLSREFETRFKDYIALDRFHIDTYSSSLTGNTEPKLTVGKEVSEDVAVIYSRGLTGTGEQEVQTEYKMMKNLSILGGWSSFGESSEGDFGADIKLRFEFR